MLEVYRKNKVFTYLFLLFLGLGLLLEIFYSKEEIFRFVNIHNNHFVDVFFKIITCFGNGFFVCIIALIFFLFKIRKALMIVISYFISGIIVQLCKQLIFTHAMRPASIFADDLTIHFVQGVKILYLNSIPSGHSASAFALFFCMSYFVKSNISKALCFLFALLVAYSRVYLVHHFFVDIFVGSIIGFISAYTGILMIHRWNPIWMDKSLVRIKQPSKDE